MPVSMSIYTIWSGSLRVTWDEAKAVSKSGKVRLPDKYSITHQMTVPESTATHIEVDSGREFQLTPVAMLSTYVFKLSCCFVGVFQPCGEVSIMTGTSCLFYDFRLKKKHMRFILACCFVSALEFTNFIFLV